MKQAFKTVWNAISTILVICAVLLALVLAGPRLFGFKTFAIVSGSMEPTYPVGSLVFTKAEDPQDYEVGDPITFMADEDTVVTHRIVGVEPDEEDSSIIRFQTKGDANEAVDGALVDYRNVVGKVLFHLPMLGYLSYYIAQPPGLYIAIIVLVMVIALGMLFDHWKEQDEKERQQQNSNAE
ncbi:signal peptidase I [Ileibacterium valens]|uniref:Signal peptidase I n=1 Tax=Ileibacterium valens TaxID=1862668 RepID=A0A1U7NHI6_9FIRM|nr:signal peptidase I [Ileibacterium valens]OLU39675.1 signal peptidase I [Erysipelotrichaceae bacterium NYU-BL-F16]OLU39994.1 signal peptidase I [Erysipelotrichaceae bacterium NYU-BL-E8]OLU41270.1 signal peptidase I [Ileibacterium valens]